MSYAGVFSGTLLAGNAIVLQEMELFDIVARLDLVERECVSGTFLLPRSGRRCLPSSNASSVR